MLFSFQFRKGLNYLSKASTKATNDGVKVNLQISIGIAA